MSSDPALRAGDADRDRTIASLREAYAEGRLSNEEFQQRLDRAQQSRTFGELAALVTDLPGTLPVPAPAPPGEIAVPDARSHGLRNGWMSWLGVSLMANVVWLGTLLTDHGDPPYYWPIWVMGPWGAAMVIRTITQRDAD